MTAPVNPRLRLLSLATAALLLVGAGCDARPPLSLPSPTGSADAAPPPAAPKPKPESKSKPKPGKDGEVVDGSRGKVERVVDGDTLHVRLVDGTRVKLRLLGMDCPESRHNSKCVSEGRKGGLDCLAQAPMGKKATTHARSLLPPSKRVALESPDDKALQTDRYGRHLGYVRMADGRDFGEVMVAETDCMDFGWRYPHPRMERYLEVQKGRTDWAAKPR